METSGSDRGERTQRRRLVAGAVAATLVVGAGVALALDRPPDTTASFDASSVTTATTIAPTSTMATTTTTTTSSSTTTTTTSTTTTALALPLQMTEPIAPPSDVRAVEDNLPLGRLSIPKLGLDAELHEGIRLTTLDRGPGHWPGSAMPGQLGNVVVAGHRTSHGAEFRHLDALAPGDELVFSTADGTFTYRVTGTRIVTPDALWIVDPTDTPTATLFACHPLGSTAERIVVNLALST
jgi:sortase A